MGVECEDEGPEMRGKERERRRLTLSRQDP